MYPTITGIILAGGKSSRMGSDKSLLKIGNTTFIERTVRLMSALFPTVLISTNSPEQYAFLAPEMIPDSVQNIGPLAGIYSCLLQSSTDKNFVISCDMPLMKMEMIQYLIEYPTTAPVTIARADGFVQQLCGVYAKTVISEIQKIIGSHNNTESRDASQTKRGCKVLELVKRVNAEIIDVEYSYPAPVNNMFFNLNKPEDYQYILEYFSKNQ